MANAPPLESAFYRKWLIEFLCVAGGCVCTTHTTGRRSSPSDLIPVS